MSEKLRIRAGVLVAALALTLSGMAAAAEPVAKPEAGEEAKPAPKPATKPQAKSDAESKAKLEEVQENLKAIFGATEPVRCYRLAGLADSGMVVGIAVELCGGSVDGAKTVQCYEEAFRSSDDDGLGLPRGLAVDLCRSIPRE